MNVRWEAVVLKKSRIVLPGIYQHSKSVAAFHALVRETASQGAASQNRKVTGHRAQP